MGCVSASPSGTGAETGTGNVSTSGPASGEESSTVGFDTDTASSSSSGDSGGSGSESSSSSGGPGDPFADDPPDGEPLPPADPLVWQWIDIEGSACRDGSPAGFAYRYGTSNNLMVFYGAGGACFNGGSCLVNRSAIDRPFAPYVGGVFADLPDNPVRDWNVVLIPYCTGDIHGGAQPQGADFPSGVGQQFVGWTNNGLFLSRLHPTFEDVDQLLVTGSSAGGFGSGANFERYANRFERPDAIMIDDSGPPLPDAYLSPCLQAHWRETWGISDTFLASCGAECNDQPDGGGMVEAIPHLSAKLPEATMGFISYLRDDTMRQFYGYGIDQCANLHAIVPPAYPADLYAEGLLELRDGYAMQPQWGTYFIEGTSHTTLTSDRFYFAQVGDVRLRDWFEAMIEGEPSHIAP